MISASVNASLTFGEVPPSTSLTPEQSPQLPGFTVELRIQQPIRAMFFKLIGQSNSLLYPLLMLPLALHKIAREEAEVIAIIPWWPKRGWFPLLLGLLVDLSIMLPEQLDLVLDPWGRGHPGLMTLQLAAWRLSGALSRQQAFLTRLHAPFVVLRESQRDLFMTQSGGYFLAGVKGDRSPSPIYSPGLKLLGTFNFHSFGTQHCPDSPVGFELLLQPAGGIYCWFTSLSVCLG